MKVFTVQKFMCVAGGRCHKSYKRKDHFDYHLPKCTGIITKHKAEVAYDDPLFVPSFVFSYDSHLNSTSSEINQYEHSDVSNTDNLTLENSEQRQETDFIINKSSTSVTSDYDGLINGVSLPDIHETSHVSNGNLTASEPKEISFLDISSGSEWSMYKQKSRATTRIDSILSKLSQKSRVEVLSKVSTDSDSESSISKEYYELKVSDATINYLKTLYTSKKNYSRFYSLLHDLFNVNLQDKKFVLWLSRKLLIRRGLFQHRLAVWKGRGFREI